jgi:hypothetical protein
MDTFEQGLLLVASVRAALMNGIRHYSLEGCLLETEEEILKALSTDGEITLDERNRTKIGNTRTIFDELKRTTTRH